MLAPFMLSLARLTSLASKTISQTFYSEKIITKPSQKQHGIRMSPSKENTPKELQEFGKRWKSVQVVETKWLVVLGIERLY